MSTTAKQAFDAVITRLQAILVSGGYNTDAGGQVYNGVRFFQDDQIFPILTVFSGDEVVEKLTYNDWRLERTVNIEGYVKDATTPTTSLEQLIEDIQRAIEQSDTTMGGLVEMIDYTGVEEIDPPEAGSDIAGVRVTYLFTYRRTYGA